MKTEHKVWFAWHPVKTSDSRRWVWWTFVERVTIVVYDQQGPFVDKHVQYYEWFTPNFAGALA